MAGTKRPLDQGSSPKPKKTKFGEDGKKSKSKPETSLQTASNLVSEEVDFPRGGGTSFTPLEVKAIRAEAVKEVNEELFADGKGKSKDVKGKRKSDAKGKRKAAAGAKSETIRVEHLNYKRITIGMKIFGQIASIHPLAMIISLPNQLWAHVPITQISTQLTERLEAMDEDQDESISGSDEEDEPEASTSRSRPPELFEIFHPGQYVRCVVTAVHAPGATEATGIGRAKDEVQKASRRVELSLVPQRVNEGVVKGDLKAGFVCSAAVKSIEDHGYILDMGIPNISGFLSFKDAKKQYPEDTRLHVGQSIDVCVSKLSGNGRTCNVTVDQESLTSSALTEVTNVTSLLPGTLVQSLITAVLPNGLNLQILGFFEGTADQFHLSGDLEADYQIGQKVKARILYDISGASSPRFAVSLADHVVKLGTKRSGQDQDAPSENVPVVPEAYPVGTILEAVKVMRVESERGLTVEVQNGVQGFIHISQTSDDHVPNLPSSSGPWKVGSTHRARVTGHFPFDGLLQLSLRASVLERRFLQVTDVEIGSVIKGTVKKLTDSALFVSLSGNVDGVVWPTHYADIMLRHPQKRFKAGGSIKCRVLLVDPERQRIALTAKRTLIESTSPIVAKFEDAKMGLVTDAVVFKASEKNLQVEFYNNLKAIVPAKEISETSVGLLSDAFPLGKPVKVRIISADASTGRIVASIRQAAPNFKSAITDISGVEIGQTGAGVVEEIHKDHAVLALQPNQVRALLSLNNLANRRGMSLVKLRTTLKTGDKVEDLVVVSRNPEKGFVLVASRPKTNEASATKGHLSMDSVQVGQIVGGRVIKHGRKGAFVKLGAHVHGSLHPADACDDYEAGIPYPAVDTILKAAVIAVDKDRQHLTLSTRRSRMQPDAQHAIVDPEYNNIDQLKVGDTVRGFIKSVAEHGLFVSLGRDIDARVQIRELFDDYVKDWKSKFEANQLVKGRVLSVDAGKKQVELSFRSGDLSKNAGPQLKFQDLFEGQKIDGMVKRIEDYGLFIELSGSKLSGLCHKSELSDNKDADVTLALRSFREGDRVKAMIISLDAEKHRISLGLKPSYFADQDLESSQEESEPEADSDGNLGVVDDQDEEMSQDEDDAEEHAHSPPEDEADDASDDEMQVDIGEQPTVLRRSSPVSRPAAPAGVPTLKLQGGFRWSGQDANAEEEASSGSSSDESDAEGQPEKKRKRRRKEIEQDLTADLHTKMPESNADFERLLLGSPNSSYLWIQYMSLQLQLSEVEKAREIGHRALQTINFREEQEKLNVWLALLNLENVYGTDETLEAVFKDAARANDSKTVHLRLAAIFEQSEKFDKAEEQFKRTAKKFGQSSKAWTLSGEHYFKRGQLEEGRKLLPRSLQSLEKRKHLKTISKFAQMEYKLGDPERGRTIFEGIVDSHPKRWDLWSVYIDMEAGQGDLQNIRHLFDRVLALKMTSHKAKSFFKRWLELERRLGDEEGQALVKQKAVEWTQKAANNTS